MWYLLKPLLEETGPRIKLLQTGLFEWSFTALNRLSPGSSSLRLPQLHKKMKIVWLTNILMTCWVTVPARPLLVGMNYQILTLVLLIPIWIYSIDTIYFMQMWSNLTCFKIIVLFYKDLLVTAALAVLWLTSSSAWARGVSDVRWETSPVKILTSINKECMFPTTKCTAGAVPYMGRLNVSVVSCVNISLLQTTTVDLKFWLLMWLMSLADFWFSQSHPVGWQLLVHLQRNAFSQISQPTCRCGGGSYATITSSK